MRIKILVFGGGSQIAQCLARHFAYTHPERCDVRKFLSVAAAIKKHKPAYVVNCAGVCNPQPIQNARHPAWMDEIQVNLMGSFNIAIACAEAKIKKMVFVASAAGLYGIANRAGYCASKAGIVSLVQTLTREGHCAYAVSPTRVNTKMVPPEEGEDMARRLEPEEVAGLIRDCLLDTYPRGSNILIRKSCKKTVRKIIKPYRGPA